MELMDLIAAGLPRAIAQDMRLSRFTLRDYVRRLGDRLGITSLLDLRRLAKQLSGRGSSRIDVIISFLRYPTLIRISADCRHLHANFAFCYCAQPST